MAVEKKCVCVRLSFSTSLKSIAWKVRTVLTYVELRIPKIFISLDVKRSQGHFHIFYNLRNFFVPSTYVLKMYVRCFWVHLAVSASCFIVVENGKSTLFGPVHVTWN